MSQWKVICRVDEIPVLATGKVDIRSVKQLALEREGGRDTEG